MRVAVVGHSEWVEFVRVPRVPVPGDIVHADAFLAEPAGGGPVAAVQLAKLAGACTLRTVLGDDALGTRSRARLGELGVDVVASVRDRTRRAITFLDDNGERTIIVLGGRLEPVTSDAVAWEGLAEMDAVYFCAGDADAVRQARRARVMVATSRALGPLREARVELDALVGSATDPSEAYAGELDPAPRLVVRTEGARGGTWWTPGADPVRFEPAPLTGPIVDAYGCGDAFAAGLTFALAKGTDHAAAIAFAARCGAAAITGAGPYEGQLRSM